MPPIERPEGLSFHHGLRGCTHGGTEYGGRQDSFMRRKEMSGASRDWLSHGAALSTIATAARTLRSIPSGTPEAPNHQTAADCLHRRSVYRACHENAVS